MLRCSTAIFTHWLPHATRVTLFEAGRVEMGESETRLLNDTKRAYVVLVAVAIVSGSVIQRLGGDAIQETISGQTSYAAFILGAVVEVLVGSKTTGQQLSSVFTGLFCTIFLAGLIEATLGL